MTVDLFAALSQTDVGRDVLADFDRIARQRDGEARLTEWLCEDGWIVTYSTTRVVGGPPAIRDKYVVMLHKPVGKGARGGRRTAQSWQRTYMRGFAKRKTARARAEALYWQHNPTRAARRRS